MRSGIQRDGISVVDLSNLAWHAEAAAGSFIRALEPRALYKGRPPHCNLILQLLAGELTSKENGGLAEWSKKRGRWLQRRTRWLAMNASAGGRDWGGGNLKGKLMRCM